MIRFLFFLSLFAGLANAVPAGESWGKPDSFEVAVLREVNSARARYGREPLQLQSALTAAAQKHAVDMAARQRMAHEFSDSTPRQRIEDSGYEWRAFAENVAAGYSSARSVVEGWLHSPGHRANLLDTARHGFSDTGIGIYRGRDGRWYFCQVFGTPAWRN